MRLVDVNVLVNAFRRDAPHHPRAFEAMEHARAVSEPLVILTEVAVGFLRVVTHPRIFRDPTPGAEAIAALEAWCSPAHVSIREAGRGRWREFVRVAREYGLSGSGVHDGLLVAAAQDSSATLLTFDRGFLRYDGLRVEVL